METSGRLRDYDITKKEWVLDGDTVLYSNHELIRQTLEYDFGQERNISHDIIPGTVLQELAVW